MDPDPVPDLDPDPTSDPTPFFNDFKDPTDKDPDLDAEHCWKQTHASSCSFFGPSIFTVQAFLALRFYENVPKNGLVEMFPPS